MPLRVALLAAAIVGSAPPALAQRPVARFEQIGFFSSFWVNLHFTLYAEALRTLSPALEGTPRLDSPSDAQLPGPLNDHDRAAWDAAVLYYRSNLARKDLAYGEGMLDIQRALAESTGKPERSPAITAEHARILAGAATVYRRHWWPTHDGAIRAWITDVATRLRQVGPSARRRQAALFDDQWLSVPVHVEITFFGRAYTMMRREVTLTTIAIGGTTYRGWAGAEMLFHEVSHSITGQNFSPPFEDRIRHASAAAGKAMPGVLWHVVLFYVTGEVWRQELATRGIAYEPFLYATGLFDRSWKALRLPVETALKPWVEGRVSADVAFQNLIASIQSS
jgi:hypothetical protein